MYVENKSQLTKALKQKEEDIEVTGDYAREVKQKYSKELNSSKAIIPPIALGMVALISSINYMISHYSIADYEPGMLLLRRTK